MAQTTIFSSLSATGTYPITKPVTADNNCGMLCLSLTGTWTEQMLHELPSINVKIFIDSTTVYSSFEINMRTIAEYTISNPTEPYVLPIYDIPSSFIFSITPMFDKNALDSHNACVETGNVEMFTTSSNGIVDSDTIDPSNYWTVPTSTFNISVIFDNSNVKAGGGSGGGGGGGGSSSATDITFSPLGTGLSSTNVQDAIAEVMTLAVLKSDNLTLNFED